MRPRNYPTEQVIEELKALMFKDNKLAEDFKEMRALKAILIRRGITPPRKKDLYAESDNAQLFDLLINQDGRGFKLVHANMSKASVARRISIFKQMGIEYKVKESVTND